MGGFIAIAAKKNGGTPIRFKFLAVLKPFFTSVNKDRKNAWGWLVLMLALLVLESGVLVTFSYTQVGDHGDGGVSFGLCSVVARCSGGVSFGSGIETVSFYLLTGTFTRCDDMMW